MIDASEREREREREIKDFDPACELNEMGKLMIYLDAYDLISGMKCFIWPKGEKKKPTKFFQVYFCYNFLLFEENIDFLNLFFKGFYI